MPEKSTTPQDPPCTCEPCTFLGVMARYVPVMPEDLDGMGDALGLVLMSPEAREAFKPVIQMFEGMGRIGRKRAARALAEMDATQRALATLLLEPAIREDLKAVVRAADRGAF